MNSLKIKQTHCKCCLTKNDLIQLTPEKERIINSLLHQKDISTASDYRICINCNSSLTCFDKFRENSLAAHNVLEKCKLKNTFLSSVTDESVNSAFDTILNWMNDVTVIMKYLTEVKAEGSETEELQEYEGLEVLHEEELFIGTVEGVPIKKEGDENDEMEIKCESEMDGDAEELNDEIEDTLDKTCKKSYEYDKKYMCDICSKKFAARKELMYHMNVHAGATPFECGINNCTKAYPHPHTLKVHQREVHYMLNGKRVEVPPDPKDPEYEAKLEELRDENFVIDAFYMEDRKGTKRQYMCRICNRYYNRTEFGYHRNIHLKRKPFDCKKCDKSFSSPFDLQKHGRKIHEKSETDDDDSDSDENPSQYENVILQNTDDDTNNYRSLEKYFIPERRGCRRAYQCPDCKKLYSRGELKYHLNTHKNVKPYSCAIEDCTRTFASPRDMRVHALKFHKIKVQPVKDYSMKNSRIYTREKIEKPYGEKYNKINVICTVCGKSVRKKHFKEHYQTHVKSEFVCPYENQGCTEVFKNKMKLTSHIQAKHDPDYLPSSVTSCMCEHCGKRLTKAQLKYHMNLHLGLTPYACEYPDCSESYRSPNLLRQHIAGYHLKHMRYKCHYCSKRFNTKEEQDQHKSENCGVKTATCHMCGRTMNKFSLKNHLLIHTGEKNFICEYEGCGKAFLRRDKLQQHKKIHSTENHYTCPYCGNGFKYKSWLDTHIEKKHGNGGTEMNVYQMVSN